MRYSAVIFDLFGTLVGSFTRQTYDRVIVQMVKALNVPYPKFWQLMGETFNDRCLGGYNSIEENIFELCHRLSVKVDMSQVEQAVTPHYEFAKDSLVPEPEVLEALGMLKIGGLHLGLITNCSPPVPSLFPQSPLAQYIDIPVFSCEERVKKPSLRIYQVMCDRLKVEPQECLYVGDGSSEELTAAAAAGMLPILKRADLTDVYDAHRPEVENWRGRGIDEIREVCDIVSELA